MDNEVEILGSILFVVIAVLPLDLSQSKMQVNMRAVIKLATYNILVLNIPYIILKKIKSSLKFHTISLSYVNGLAFCTSRGTFYKGM